MIEKVFKKSNSNKLIAESKLNFTSDYTLKIISKMVIGESIVFNDYALKRIR